ncbi:3'(2'),5'-bisphosphate nucleotidase CysQ [Flavobacterium sp.]|uniref:3'(2'),5'-bisphosphate nucleotidase CysQ n=1 Tax=Flavobacterium sp. TaxID=239 RepID=UPI0038FC7BB9
MNTDYIIAIEASIAAGKVIMEIYQKDFQIDFKNDNSPLTEADIAANAVIMEYLNQTGIPIISEENKQTPYSIRKNWISCWIVDPLDGTKEFVKKNGEFTVNIALVKNGLPEFGVIYVPATGVLYFGDVSRQKAYRITIDHSNYTISDILKNASEIQPQQNLNTIRVVGSRSHMNQETLDFVENLRQKSQQEIEMVSKGSSLKFCLVADGNADVYPRFAPTMEWDTAAGQAICMSVGLKVIDNTTNLAMKYNKESLLNSFFLVSNEL